MSGYKETLDALRKARAERDKAREDLYELRVRQLKLLRAQRKAERKEVNTGPAPTAGPGHEDVSGKLDQTRQLMPVLQRDLIEREKAVGGLLGGLFQLPPQKLIEEWSDGTPILLLPLRVETRFKEAGAGQELWVRVFPDEVAVATHEKVLTELEEQRGIAYWKALRGAMDDKSRKDAWGTLADKSGANRAAWVALQTKPLNWSTPPPASDADLQFPVLELTKPDRWTQAPHSRVMPDRLVLMAYRGGKAVHTRVGEQISDALVLGPAPLEEEGNPSIRRNPADNRLEYGEELRWLFDFQLAVERGLGFRVPLDAADAAGFDQLLVLGLKLSADEKDGQKLIEELIENHHYSAKGFSLVRQGSPTNNTDNGDSRFGTDDWLHDLSYFVETGEPLFTYEPDPAKATDGQRLAEYLGLDYAPLQYIGNSGAADHAEAVAMNRALYAGTLGYYLDSMLNEVMSDEAIAALRELFTEHVTGRGPLPAIRVGNQPYGVLVTSSFPRWTYPKFAKLPFEEHVRRFLLHLHGQWQTLAPQLRHIGKKGDARENLMNVLGLQPTSADYYQRVGYSYDYLSNLEQFAWGGKYVGDIFLLIFERMSGRQFLRSFGYDEQRDDGTPKPVPLLLQLIYQHFHVPLDPRNLVDSLPLSEERTLKAYDEGTGKNYIHWLLDHASNVDKLERQDFGTGVARPNALLYMMLHNALLHEAKHGIYQLLKRNDITADELVRSRKFMNISSQPDVSHWEVFRAPANRVLAAESSDLPLLEYVQLERFTMGAEIEVGHHFSKAKEALLRLRDLPTARLERALAEHVDTLNYRLDSWQTALFDRRLREQRELAANDPQRRMGAYLGGYGYLENVRPAPETHVKVPDQSLPSALQENKENLYISRTNGGYVHTPSLNHATAAAILRNGYLTHASPEEHQKLAVNLSSERVRRAKYLIDGVRNGQSLEALLGYLFERGLHDWTTRSVKPVILDHLKPFFRKAFPIKRTKIPRRGFASEPAEVIEDYQVVNGLDLARMTAPFPASVAGLPVLDGSQTDALRKEKTNIENSLDAMRDVLTAECAYQLALGNFDRAAAVMQAISGSQLPVEIEVARSSRGTELGFTNRVTVQLDPALSANPWPAIPPTRRALTEPGLNHWIGEMLGDPAKIQCRVRAVDAGGTTLLDGTSSPIEGSVSLADLGLQPIDLMYLIRKTAEATAPAEIESRIRHHFARAWALADSAIVKIGFGESGSGDPDVRAFAEILPFADAIREMVGKARPLNAQDFASPSKTVAAPAGNPGNVDAAELQARVAGVRAAFDALFADLKTAADDAEAQQTEPAVELLRQRLAAVADAGVVHAFPLSATGFGEAELSALLAQGRSLLGRYDAVKAAYDAHLAAVNAAGTKPPQKVTLLTEMAKGLLGGDFVLLPRFTLINAADVAQAHLHRDQLLDYARNTRGIHLPVDEWLHGVSLVRPSLHTFATVMTLSETFNLEAPPCNPMQLPFQDQDTWLGTEFPEDKKIVHDTIAMVQCMPQGFQPLGAQSGLLIDEWMEQLPKREEVTGITFNYDQPNSAPPAALLLAVAPELTGHWRWDDLTAAVLDTIERAKLRAVEPDMIENLEGFATLLPSTIAEFSTGKSTISLDFSLNLSYLYEQFVILSGENLGEL